MCRNIKTLHNFAPPATEAEIRASAIQFVRKLSGFNHPSKINEAVWDRAIEDVTSAARALISSLVTEESYLQADHLINARGGRMVSPLDGLLGAERSVVVSAPTVSSLWILLDTDLVGLCYEQLERAAVRAIGLTTFAIPYELELIPICQSWHAGHDTDPVHRWLRQVVHHVVGTIPRYEG